MRLIFACLSLALTHAHAAAFKPFHVLSLSGTASLTRFEDEAWPLEAGQDLPGDFSLTLGKGAFIHLRVMKRVEIAVAGPASMKSFVLDHQDGELLNHDLVLRLERGEFLADPRFLLNRASQIRLDLPDANFELMAGTPTAFSVDPTRPTRYATSDAQLCELAVKPVSVLVLARDYDKELKAWPRPAILGPALVSALKGLPGLELADGSGDTKLASYANGAIKKGEDDFLQMLARDKGARFVVVGNLVSDEVRDDNLRRTALMQGIAEIRILEALPGGDVIVSDTATTTMARAGRSLEIVGPKVMHMAADRAALYIRDDVEGLLKGESHPPLLLKISFNGVKDMWMNELRRGLGGLTTVSRFFKRGYSSGVFRADVILRKNKNAFLAQLYDFPFKNFTLESNPDDRNGGLVFTLRKGPEPTPTPTPKHPLDWRR